MRDAARRAYRELTGREAEFCFSGWAAELTEGELAVVENRAPRPDAVADARDAARWRWVVTRLDIATGEDGPCFGGLLNDLIEEGDYPEVDMGAVRGPALVRILDDLRGADRPSSHSDSNVVRVCTCRPEITEARCPVHGTLPVGTLTVAASPPAQDAEADGATTGPSLQDRLLAERPKLADAYNAVEWLENQLYDGAEFRLIMGEPDHDDGLVAVFRRLGGTDDAYDLLGRADTLTLAIEAARVESDFWEADEQDAADAHEATP